MHAGPCIAKGVDIEGIDDHLHAALHAAGLPHTKEPHYPEGNYRADFAVGDDLAWSDTSKIANIWSGPFGHLTDHRK